jgi:hypothetical protein
MAQRPVYQPVSTGELLVSTRQVEFVWTPGQAPVQKQKNVVALHLAAQDQLGIRQPLEISSKSTLSLGVAASAFNLIITTPQQRRFSVEAAFQSSKVFERGGPYTDLLEQSARQARQDPRLRASGELLAFRFFRQEWPLQPITAFYDWLYLNALRQNPDIANGLLEYDAFTDIEFNPQRSLNCQAYTAALYVALHRKGLLHILDHQQDYLRWINSKPVQNAHQDTQQQPALF